MAQSEPTIRHLTVSVSLADNLQALLFQHLKDGELPGASFYSDRWLEPRTENFAMQLPCTLCFVR